MIGLGILVMLPFLDFSAESTGIYFRSHRGRALSLFAIGVALIVVPAWVLADEFLLEWSGWLPGWPSLVSNGADPTYS